MSHTRFFILNLIMWAIALPPAAFLILMVYWK